MAEIGKRLASSLGRIKRRGGIVLVHHGVPGGAASYQLQDGGEVASGTVKKLVDAGLLESNRDGLLDGIEQSFRVIA